MQFHPLAYIVKLNIEMSMADLIRRIAKSKDNNASYNNSARNGSNGSNYYAALRSRGTSISGPTKDKKNNTRPRECNDGLSIPARAEFHNVLRPDAAYVVGATATPCVESGLYNWQSIYTTREYCIDFEDKSDQSADNSAERGEVTSTSRRDYEDTKALE